MRSRLRSERPAPITNLQAIARYSAPMSEICPPSPPANETRGETAAAAAKWRALQKVANWVEKEWRDMQLEDAQIEII